MIEKLRANKIIFFAIETLIFIALMFVMVHRMKGDNVFVIPLDGMTTSHSEVVFDGTSWKLDAEDANGLVGDGYVVFGPNIPLEHGTYTLVLNYNTTKIQKGVVEVDGGYLETADYFLLSNNKHEARYDFKLDTDVDAFRFRLKEYMGGDFELTGVTIIRNTHDIRILVFLWIVLSVILDLILYNKFVSQNKKVIGIVIGITFLASLPLFFKGMMTGDDIRYHLVRIEGIVDGLKSGAFPVKMYSVYNDDYGYPVGIFYGDILLYIPAFLRIIGFTVMQSYKIYIFGINLLTSAIAYYAGKKMFRSDMHAVLFTTVYTFSTYRLVCLYARAAMGEYSATCFYPLVMLAFWNIYTQDIKSKEYKKNALTLAIGMAGLIYCHILSTEMFVMALLIIALAMFKKTFRKETFGVLMKAVVLCGLICAAFIVPFMEYYTGVDITIKHRFEKSYIQSQGAYLSDYFAVFKSITGGNFVTRRGLLTPGLILMAGLLVAIVFIVAGKADKKIKVMTLGSVISLFVASNLFPWNRINEVPVIGNFLVSVQFPYRYIGIAVCFLAILLVLVLEKLAEMGVTLKKFFAGITLASVIMTLLFVSEYQDEAFVTSIFRSYDTADLLTYTRTGDFGMYLGTIYLIQGTSMDSEVLDYGVYGENVNAVMISESGVNLQVYVEATENATLEVPRFAYPHIVARDKDGNKLMTTAGNNNKLTVAFDKPYTGEVYIAFEEPLYWRMAELISLLTIIGLVVTALVKKNVEGKGVNA